MFFSLFFDFKIRCEHTLFLLRAGIVLISVTVYATPKGILINRNSYPQTYVLNVRTRQDKDAVKMVNHGSANANRIEFEGEGGLQYKPLKCFVGEKDLPFECGDRMQYVGLMAEGEGYVMSDTVEQIQENNEIIDLSFSLWTPFVEPRHYIDTTTLFIPDGIFCDSGCFATKTIHVEDYQNDAVVNAASDIKYVRLNMEHSYIWYFVNAGCAKI